MSASNPAVKRQLPIGSTYVVEQGYVLVMSIVFQSLSYICSRTGLSTCRVVCFLVFKLHISLKRAKGTCQTNSLLQ